MTASNYKEAVSILEKRFRNTEQIISRNMDLLLNLEPVSAVHGIYVDSMTVLKHMYAV